MRQVKGTSSAYLGCLTVLAALLSAQAVAGETNGGTYDPQACGDTDDLSLHGCCCSDYFSSDCCDPLWTATADALFLTRSKPAPRGVLYDSATDAEVFNFSDFDFDYQTGQRLRLLRRVGATSALSIEYFGIENLDAHASFGPGNYDFIAEADGGPNVTSMDLGYETELHNVEVSLWGGMDRRFSLFGGFRWLRLDDDFRIAGIQSPSDGNAPFTGVYSGDNNLYGLQVGSNGMLLEMGRLHLDGFAKAGIYYNDVDTRFLAQSTSFGQFLAEDATGQTAFIGELGLNLTFNVTSHIALRGGYQVLWLSGIATAPGQLASTSANAGTTTVNATDSMFLHGANAGLELTW